MAIREFARNPDVITICVDGECHYDLFVKAGKRHELWNRRECICSTSVQQEGVGARERGTSASS